MPRRKQEQFAEAEVARLKSIVGALEEILEDRRKSSTKRYTLEAMYEQVPTYQNARHRPDHSRLLTFEEVMTLCDYLDCSTPERNRVLENARYEPVLRSVAGEELEAALATAREVLAYLPMPAYILTQDWHVHAWNPYVLKLLGWTDSFAKSLQRNKQMNILHIIFDPTIRMRQHLGGEDGTWEEMAFRNVYTFKTVNWLYRHDQWFTQEVERLKKLPDFAHFWDIAQVDIAHPKLKAEFVTQIRYKDGRVFRFRSLFISNGSFYYPHIGAYMPLDEESCNILRSLGIPVISDLVS